MHGATIRFINIACFLPGRAKDLSAPLYCPLHMDLLNGHPKYVQSQNIYIYIYIQGDAGRRVNILGGNSIGHCEKRKDDMNMQF